ncbi:MAG: PQQ-dependent sugar dehydrogenase [Anaerolineae bacterium]|nr:PQQ-dependent sugar dehydrogenase [Anaerolineae bacterium]
MASAHDGTGRLFVVDQVGKIRIIGSDGKLMTDPFLDLSGLIVPLKSDYDERGTLGLAFHPDYAKNGRFFVYYTTPLRTGAPAGWDHTNTLAEFSVSKDNPNKGDLASQKTVLQIDQPEFNHDSGHITFGPDGYLYIPIGDGGGANDVDVGHTPNFGNAQDLSELHGSILRIDVNGNPGDYTVPKDNPFVGQDKIAPEIYAYGLRNPYHISFDMGGDKQLFAADAGQNEYEEVDIVTAGGNYGWNIKEGTHCFNAKDPKTEIDSCASTGADGKPLIDPIIEYSHDQVGVVVIGGYIYRGSAITNLAGYYIFGDYNKANSDQPDGTLLWAEAPDSGTGMWKWGELKVASMPNDRLGAHVLGIGQGDDGELYVMTSQSGAPTGDTGKVWKLVPAEGTSSESTAEATSKTGATNMPNATAAPQATTAPAATSAPAATPAPATTPG